MKIRLFQSQDTAQVAQLFHDTVRNINRQDYSQAQVEAWAPDDIHFTDWAAKCHQCFTYVADDHGIVAGFGQLQSNGYIDCFYIHKDYQGQGIGNQLYQVIETQAQSLGVDRLFTEASITAKPFFQRMGLLVLQTQTVSCRNQTFINYQMEKRLTPAV